MSKTRFVLSIAVVALMVATPAMGQVLNVPVLALAAGDADGVTSIGAGFARGLNEDSGKLNAIAVGVSRGMEKVSFGVSAGYILSDTAKGLASSEISVAGKVAYHVINDSDSPANVSVQVGVGWAKPGDDPNDVTLLLIPVGVAISGSTEAGGMMVNPWVMPRVQFTRVSPSGGTSSTETDFGASAGVGFTTEGGFGFGVAVDLLITDDGLGGSNSEILFGVGVSYTLP